ncbi:MAG: T9SS type A sorting domain-containing protein [Saprospiraceae bacterium]
MKRLFTFLSFLFIVSLISAQNKPDNYCGYTGKSEWLIQYQKDKHSNPSVSNRSGAITWLPLQIHVVGDDNGNGYFQPRNILDALCTLNEDFEDSDIRFYLKDDFNYLNNTDWFVHNFGNGRDMMRQNNVDNAVNAYIVEDPAGNCGYYSPGPDALAIAKNCSGKDDHTFSHEVGHYLSLPHPFVGWEGETPERGVNAPEFINGREVEKVDRSNCYQAGDGFCDTDADYLSARWTCNGDSRSSQIYLDPNGEEVSADGTLYMSYANDGCSNRFSEEQMDAMHANINDERRDLLLNPSPLPAIDPNATITLNTPDPSVIGTTEALLDWEPVPNATYYLIQVALVPNMSLVIDQGIVKGTSFLASNLMEGRPHYWRIRPFNEFNFCGDYSQIASFRAMADVTSVNDLKELADFKLAPQPVGSNEQLTISFLASQAQHYKLRMMDLNGKTVQTDQLDAFQGQVQHQMNINNAHPGLYFLEISNEWGKNGEEGDVVGR